MVVVASQEFVKEVDPDIIIGYNICKFDLPYLIEVSGHQLLTLVILTCLCTFVYRINYTIIWFIFLVCSRF